MGARATQWPLHAILRFVRMNIGLLLMIALLLVATGCGAATRLDTSAQVRRAFAAAGLKLVVEPALTAEEVRRLHRRQRLAPPPLRIFDVRRALTVKTSPESLQVKRMQSAIAQLLGPGLYQSGSSSVLIDHLDVAVYRSDGDATKAASLDANSTLHVFRRNNVVVVYPAKVQRTWRWPSEVGAALEAL